MAKTFLISGKDRCGKIFQVFSFGDVMKKMLCILLACLILAGCAAPVPVETVPTVPAETILAETEAPTEAPSEIPTEIPTEPPTEPATEPPETEPPVVVELTDEEKDLLLRIGMAELGKEKCETCIALVMCTVLNRVRSERFSSTVKGVLYAQDQFTPVMDGSFDKAVPNDACYAALDLVIHGWDESQGALFYEFCEGESWHSKNLKLLTEHCNTRFYE